MKLASTSILLSLVCLLFTAEIQAQCELTNAVIELNDVSDNSGNCIVNVNLSFTIDKNGGNKYTYIHLWLPANYPNPAIDYEAGGAKGPLKTALGNVLATLAMDTDGAVSLLSTYRPDPSNVPVLFTGLTLTEQSLGGNLHKVTIDNIQLTIPGACAALPILRGDIWSTQSDGTTSPIHCGDNNFALSVGDPIIAGLINCNPPNGPRTYDLDITTTSPADISVTYKVYLDDGVLTNGLTTFSASDNLIFTSAPTNISAASPLNIDGASYSYGTGEDARVLWIVVSGPSLANAMLAEIHNPCTPVVLPVKLANLAGNQVEKGVSITWQTTEEISNSHFEIERSKTTAGNFLNIGSVQSKGTGSQLISYSFFDASPATGINYYRLKQVDTDGKFEYSRIISVKNEFSDAGYIVIGNPTSGKSIILKTPDNKSLSVNLFDRTGVAVPVAVKQTNNKLALTSPGQLPAGVYIIKIQRSNAIISKTIVVQ